MNEKDTKKRQESDAGKKSKLRKMAEECDRCQVARETRAQISCSLAPHFFQRKNETTLPHFSKEYSKTKQLFLLFSRLGGEKKILETRSRIDSFPIFPIFGNQITGCRYEKWFTELKNGDTQTS